MHHSLLVLPQILCNTGFSELFHATFVSHVFTTRHFYFQQHYFPNTLKYLMQLPTVYIWKNQTLCVQSVQLSTFVFCRTRFQICTEAGSLNSKGDMTHAVLMGKNSIKPALRILQCWGFRSSPVSFSLKEFSLYMLPGGQITGC